MSTEIEVRKASEQFYAALNRMINGDAAPLEDIWSHSGGVTTMHPIGGRQVGWEEVRGSWDQVARFATGGKVALTDQILQCTDDMAYELGVERGDFVLAGQPISNFENRVTNVYRREPAGWKIVHHHTDISQPMLHILARLRKT